MTAAIAPTVTPAITGVVQKVVSTGFNISHEADPVNLKLA